MKKTQWYVGRGTVKILNKRPIIENSSSEINQTRRDFFRESFTHLKVTTFAVVNPFGFWQKIYYSAMALFFGKTAAAQFVQHGTWKRRSVVGTLWTWGTGSGGRLGDGSTVTKSSPVQVGTLTTWSKVAAGRSHSVAIKTDGTLWAWGNNTNGQLGDGTVSSKSSPVQIGVLKDWANISAFNHTIATK